MDFSGGLDGKESACNAGDWGLIPVLGRCPREGKRSPLQYSGLENTEGRKSQTRLRDFHINTGGLPWWLRGKESACQCVCAC